MNLILFLLGIVFPFLCLQFIIVALFCARSEQDLRMLIELHKGIFVILGFFCVATILAFTIV